MYLHTYVRRLHAREQLCMYVYTYVYTYLHTYVRM